MTDEKDPELLENDAVTESVDVYDVNEVSAMEFDADQFELPAEYEYEGDDND